MAEPSYKKHSATRLSDLPQEVTTEILVRLPVKSLLRCRAVSRLWRTRITNPSFVNLHLHRSASNPQFLIHDYGSMFSHLRLNPHSPENSVIHDVPSSLGEDFAPIATCNGILLGLLYDKFANEIHILWNPATRHSHFLPKHTLPDYEHLPFGVRKAMTPSWGALSPSSGFGFDAVDNDYKVVRFLPCVKDFVNDRRIDHVRAEVYSGYRDQWREINVAFNFSAVETSCHCSFDGVVYWQGKTEVVAFDLNKEEFTTFVYPPDLSTVDRIKRVFNYKDSVAVAVVTNNKNISFWCLNFDDNSGGYSWRKELSSDLIPEMTDYYVFLRSGHFIATIGHTCLYDPVKKVAKRLPIQDDRQVEVFDYTESLVSLGGFSKVQTRGSLSTKK